MTGYCCPKVVTFSLFRQVACPKKTCDYKVLLQWAWCFDKHGVFWFICGKYLFQVTSEPITCIKNDLSKISSPTWIDLKEKVEMGIKAYLEPKKRAQVTNFPYSPISSHKVIYSHGLEFFYHDACDTGVFSWIIIDYTRLYLPLLLQQGNQRHRKGLVFPGNNKTASTP